jgi:hypothetical protein
MKAFYTLVLVFFGAVGALFAWSAITLLFRGNTKDAVFPAIFVVWMWILAGGAWLRLRKEGKSKEPIQPPETTRGK